MKDRRVQCLSQAARELCLRVEEEIKSVLNQKLSLPSGSKTITSSSSVAVGWHTDHWRSVSWTEAVCSAAAPAAAAAPQDQRSQLCHWSELLQNTQTCTPESDIRHHVVILFLVCLLVLWRLKVWWILSAVVQVCALFIITFVKKDFGKLESHPQECWAWNYQWTLF